MCFYAGAYVGFKARMAGDKELVANQEVENPALQRSATQKLMQSATENPTMLMAFNKLYTRKNVRTNRESSGNPLIETNGDGMHTDKMECGLCWETFQMTDEVFNCKNNHVFHTRCYDDRAMDTEGIDDEMTSMMNKCPTCGAQMNISLDQQKAPPGANAGPHRYSINQGKY